ncbi:hypothetical protein MLD38_037915 [Melastoma candidum]|uniref:Uncharacterized protein n=1 Tax=Melastoma candidum TaxID=119954 RepID=A0ACB9KYA5_9MYRT|nr:hypothetical protein MLD38_037915 [Melastoma candidum]
MAALSGLLLWMALAGFPEVRKGAGNTYTMFPNSSQEDIGGGMENEPKAEVVASSRPPADLNYESERRVPRGPDPIHNRRAGSSRQPPGQA